MRVTYVGGVPHTAVFFHAHPDDEAMLTAGTMAKAAAAGHRVVVVFATRGEVGEAATERLREWLNEGAFSLESVDRDVDRYGRKLRVVTRGGASAGAALIDEGLAREWTGYRRPWC